MVLYNCVGEIGNNIRIGLNENDTCVPPVEVEIFECKYYLLIVLLFE